MSFIRPATVRALAAPRLAVAPRVAIAPFHTTQKRNIMPAGPQILEGTVNDAAHVPEPSPSHGSYHWTFERLLAIGLVPLTVAPFVAGTAHPVLDAVLGATVIAHSHIGFQACITDYFPKRKWGGLNKASTWALNVGTAVVLYGLYEFETNDVGITEGVKKIWKA